MAALLEVSGWRAKLGEVLVNVAGMENPPKQFLAGSDALTVVTPVLETRLQEIRAHEDLSQVDGWHTFSKRFVPEPLAPLGIAVTYWSEAVTV